MSDTIRFYINPREVDAGVKNLSRLLKAMKPKERRKLLRKGAVPIVKAISQAAPVDKKGRPSINRYKPLKRGAGTRKKAAKGQGKPVAWYALGHLKKAIRILNLRRTTAIHIGGQRFKKDATGGFGFDTVDKSGKSRKSQRLDAYYMGWVAFGHKIKGGRRSKANNFVEKGFNLSVNTAMLVLAKAFRKAFKNAIVRPVSKSRAA